MTDIPLNPAPRMQMDEVAKLIQETIDSKRPHCVIDEELFDSTKIALREKGYDYQQDKRRTYIGVYPNAAMYAYLDACESEGVNPKMSVKCALSLN